VQGAVSLCICLSCFFQIYRSLSSIDLPEAFEDSLANWMATQHVFLTFKTAEPALLGTDEKPGQIHRLQTAMARIVNLYVEKYEDEVTPFLGQAIGDIWALLTTLTAQPKCASVNILAACLLLLTCLFLTADTTS
jgi:hypothetical protein